MIEKIDNVLSILFPYSGVSPSRNEQFLYTGAGAKLSGPHSSDTHLPASVKLPESIVNFKDGVAMTKLRPDSK